MADEFPFLPGEKLNESGLLSRFLPPVPDGLIAPWIEKTVQPGSLILDPFGASPGLTLQIARTGNKVISCVNNPIARFLLTLEANPATEEVYRAALAELARCRVGEERLEIHLANLYRTQCSQCGNSVFAEEFIWEKGTKYPTSKISNCKHCGNSGEHPVTQADIDSSQNFPASSMHRMRIIERITTNETKVRNNLMDALAAYQPRALYALVTLINRLESILITLPENESIKRNCLIALVLYALDHGSNLWTYPSGRPRPKQLSSSPLFREFNIWMVLEKAVYKLPHLLEPVDIRYFPDFPENNNAICIFEGPLRNLVGKLNKSNSITLPEINGVVTAIPRHNQAYWTLSALWAGWIWGREALGNFKSVLLRRRYDWSWHSSALNRTFSTLKELLDSPTPILSLIPEAESGFVISSIVAGSQAQYSMKGISYRADENFAQIHWDCHRNSVEQISAPLILRNTLQDSIVQEGINYLQDRGEPVPYIILNLNSLKVLADKGGISRIQPISPADEYSRIQRLIENSLTYKHGFIRHGGGEKSLENAVLWHQEINKPRMMLTDRVETAIRQLIDEREGQTIHNIDTSICQRYPGLRTPDFEFVNLCINSYCDKNSLAQNSLMLRKQDTSERRNLEIEENCLLLHELGEKLGYATSGENPVIWNNMDDISYVYYVLPSGEIGEIVFQNPYPPGKSILVIPGARSNLLLYKFRKNFHLEQIIGQGWRFLKFRHLRHLMDSPTLNKDSFDFELGLDPLTETPAQMRLL